MTFKHQAFTFSSFLYLTVVYASSQPLQMIGFGSCNVHTRPQPVWSTLISFKIELFIWLGDVVYADQRSIPFSWSPSPIETMIEKFNAQKYRPDYQQFLKACPVIGVWDDHDYGINDGGGEYVNKSESQKVFLDFIDEPRNSSRWNRPGIYSSYTFGPIGKRVKVILLDCRYFRTLPNPNGDILGDTQWKWLENELSKNDAEITLIGSGIQVLPYDKPIQEKWGKFPISYKRLLKLIYSSPLPNIILLSGDVHYGEIFRKTCYGIPLYEITSSGLTHSCQNIGCQYYIDYLMHSKYQISNFYVEQNVGMIIIDWDKQELKLQVRGLNGTVALEQLVKLEKKITIDTQEIENCFEWELDHQYFWAFWAPITWAFIIIGIILIAIILIIYICCACLCCRTHEIKNIPKKNQ